MQLLMTREGTGCITTAYFTLSHVVQFSVKVCIALNRSASAGDAVVILAQLQDDEEQLCSNDGSQIVGALNCLVVSTSVVTPASVSHRKNDGISSTGWQ